MPIFGSISRNSRDVKNFAPIFGLNFLAPKILGQISRDFARKFGANFVAPIFALILGQISGGFAGVSAILARSQIRSIFPRIFLTSGLRPTFGKFGKNLRSQLAR